MATTVNGQRQDLPSEDKDQTKDEDQKKKSVHNVEIVDQESKNDEEFPTIADENVSTKIQFFYGTIKSQLRPD